MRRCWQTDTAAINLRDSSLTYEQPILLCAMSHEPSQLRANVDDIRLFRSVYSSGRVATMHFAVHNVGALPFSLKVVPGHPPSNETWLALPPGRQITWNDQTFHNDPKTAGAAEVSFFVFPFPESTLSPSGAIEAFFVWRELRGGFLLGGSPRSVRIPLTPGAAAA